MHLLSKEEDMHFTNCYLKNISNHPELLVVVERIRKEVKTIRYEKALTSLLHEFIPSFMLLIPYFSYRGRAK